MGMMDIAFWPFAAAFAGAMMLVAIIIIILWVLILIDCARRKFKNDAEKIIWIVVIVLAGWIGALVYFIVVRSLNPKGLMKRS